MSAAPGSSPLLARLIERIRRFGPISIAEYMATALGDPEHGYYRTRDPLGAAGDFVTAPEISQMFGELVGLWAAVVWQQMGSPGGLRLVELGPGRGTLMTDLLRAARSVPGFRESLAVHLVETSETLRSLQKARLGEDCLIWHESLAEVPDGPVIVIANEFFDALPVRQFQRAQSGWHERLVDVDEDGHGLRLVLSPAPLPGLPAATDGEGPPGTVREVSPGAIALDREIARRIEAGGAALIVDYGPASGGVGETLQAVRCHAHAPVLEAPGDADLTAHVDFRALCRAAVDAGARAHGPISQATWLGRLGIEARAAVLKREATPEQAAAVDAACRRLIGSDEMGTLFKVLALTGPDLPAPPGFEEDD